jgi:hypothetical protein
VLLNGSRIANSLPPVLLMPTGLRKDTAGFQCVSAMMSQRECWGENQMLLLQILLLGDSKLVLLVILNAPQVHN